MRDRLIQLIDEAINDESTSYSNIADYLLENGVIAPPCKGGDIICCTVSGRVKPIVVSVPHNRSGRTGVERR